MQSGGMVLIDSCTCVYVNCTALHAEGAHKIQEVVLTWQYVSAELAI